MPHPHGAVTVTYVVKYEAQALAPDHQGPTYDHICRPLRAPGRGARTRGSSLASERASATVRPGRGGHCGRACATALIRAFVI